MKKIIKLTCLGLVMIGLAAWLAAPAGALGTKAAASAVGLAYQWHTFYGAAGGPGELRSVAVDAGGNVYLAGYSSQSWGSPLHPYTGDADILVVKLNSLGEYQWHTFYGAAPSSGSDGDDEAMGIALDGSGNLYVTGYSDRAWLGAGDAQPLNPHGGDAEYMFVLKLDPNGAYQWHTFYQPGRANAVAAGGDGVYITGFASAAWGSPLHAFTGNLVILKLDLSGSYQWHTYYGAMASAADEAGYALAVDASRGTLYLTGSAPDSWLGDASTQPLHAFSGGGGYSTDIFALKLDSDGGYQWHTFYGAADYDDFGYGIAVDGTGSPAIAGYSFDTWGSPLHALSGERDISVLKLDVDGAYQWNTFYGSPANDIGYGIALDDGGNIYVAGESANTWQGDGGRDPVHAHALDSTDLAVLKLDRQGAYQCHTFYGAAGYADAGLGLAVDSQQAVYVTGPSASAWNGDGGIPPLHPHSGNDQGESFALKLNDRVVTLYLPLALRK
jgi:hypothetical protein